MNVLDIRHKNINKYYIILLTLFIMAILANLLRNTYAAVDKTPVSFSYTGDVQEYITPYTGIYKIETWGAQGGDNASADTGGKGGYSAGEIQLVAGDKLNLYIGGQGSTSNNSHAQGGWNGGGSSGNYSNYAQGGGGGSTDIRINSTDLHSRIIVAGGGGGSGSNHGSNSLINKGGAGGGTLGQDGFKDIQYIGLGGSQTEGGDTGTDSRRDALNGIGSFGAGGGMLAGSNSGKTTGGGGGSGWYGGGAGVYEGGGGGSGWTFTEDGYLNWKNNSTNNESDNWAVDDKYYLANAITIAGNNQIPSPENPNQNTLGRSGDGYAKITPIDIPTPEISSLSKNQGDIAGGETIIISGSGFTEDTEFWFGDIKIDQIELIDSNTVRIITPANSAGTIDIIAKGNGQINTLSKGFTYIAKDEPAKPIENDEPFHNEDILAPNTGYIFK